MRRDALLDVIVTKNEGLLGDVKIKGRLGAVTMRQWILRAGRSVKCELKTPGVRRFAWKSPVG